MLIAMTDVFQHPEHSLEREICSDWSAGTPGVTNEGLMGRQGGEANRREKQGDRSSKVSCTLCEINVTFK